MTSLLDDATYYLLLLLLVFFTAGLAFLIMPLMLVGNVFVTYLTLTFLGVSFGIFVSVFIRDLERLTKHHHAGIWAIVLFGSIINFVAVYLNSLDIMTAFANREFVSNPFLAGLLFSASFAVPYALFLVKNKKRSVQRG